MINCFPKIQNAIICFLSLPISLKIRDIFLFCSWSVSLLLFFLIIFFKNGAFLPHWAAKLCLHLIRKRRIIGRKYVCGCLSPDKIICVSTIIVLDQITAQSAAVVGNLQWLKVITNGQFLVFKPLQLSLGQPNSNTWRQMAQTTQ